MKTKVEETEYKGHNIISIVEETDGKYPTRLSFGLAKAEMIIANFKAIKAFADKTKAAAKKEAETK